MFVKTCVVIALILSLPGRLLAETDCGGSSGPWRHAGFYCQPATNPKALEDAAHEFVGEVIQIIEAAGAGCDDCTTTQSFSYPCRGRIAANLTITRDPVLPTCFCISGAGMQLECEACTGQEPLPW